MIPDWIRYLTFGAAVYAVVAWVYVARKLQSWLYVLVPLLWLLNVIAFNAERILCRGCLSVAVLNSWSLGIQIHGIVTLIGIAYILLGDTWKR